MDNKKEKLRGFLFGHTKASFQMPKIESELYHLLKKNIKFEKNQTIAGYHPARHEFDILNILKDLSNNHTIALPISDGKTGTLVFRKWNSFGELTANNSFGILEPSIDSEEVIPNIILVPCVGLTKHGHRIGYGYGHYERTINYLKSHEHDFLTIGIGYEHQLVSSIPYTGAEPLLDWVITNRQVFDCRN